MAVHTFELRNEFRALLRFATQIPLDHWPQEDVARMCDWLRTWGLPSGLTPEGLAEAEAAYQALNAWEDDERIELTQDGAYAGPGRR